MEDDNIAAAFFKSLLSSPKQMLAAPALLTDKITTDNQFLSAVLEYLANGEEKVRQDDRDYFNVITMLHPILIDTFADLSENVLEDVRSGLLSAVVALHPSLRCVAGLALIIREILEIDSLDPWFQPLGQLLKWSGSDDVAIMHAGIEFFLHLLKETSYTRNNSELPFFKLAPLLLESLFQIFAHPELSEAMRQKLLYLVLQLVKTFSMLDGIQDETVRQCFDGTFQLWMSIFISALQGTINLNLGIKKYILKILVVIFRDMQRYLSLSKYQQPTQIYVVWEFSYKILPLFLWTHVWQKPLNDYILQPNNKSNNKISFPYYDDDSDALLLPLQSLAHSILQFLSVLTSISQLQTTLKLSVHHLINILFHYMLMPERDILGWKSNNQYFTSQGNSFDYQLTIRNKCIGIINELIQKFGDLAIQAVLVISQKFLLNLNEESTSSTIMMIAQSLTQMSGVQTLTGGVYQSEAKYTYLVKISSCDIKQTLKLSGQSWRKIQIGLLILGRFAEDIIVFQSKQSGSFDIEGFVKGIVRQVRDQDYHSLLKGQSLYCLTRFTEIISIKYKNLFGQLIMAAGSCNRNNYPLPLRLISCKALTMFLKKIQKHKLQLSTEQIEVLEDVQIIERIVELPFYHETMQYIIDTLVELSKNKQLRNKLNKPQPQYFLALFHQCLSQQSLLSLFIGLLEGVSEEYNIFSRLVAIFIPFASECLKAFHGIIGSAQKNFLKPADTELILTILRVASVFIQRTTTHQDSDRQKERMIQMVSTAIEIMDINEDIQVQVALSLYLKGLLRIAADLIFSKKDIVELYVKAVRILLKIPKEKSFQSASIYSGNLVILVCQKLLKKNHNQILQEIVLKVFRSRTPSVIQSLVLVYSRLINQGTTKQNKFKSNVDLQANAKGVVDFLSSFSIQNRMGLKILIDKWLLQQSLFRGKYTKISTFMALSKLFLLSDKRVDNLLVIGFNPSHTNVNNDVNAPLKIIATLIRCLDNELGGSKRGEDSEDDEQDVEIKQQGLQVNLQKFKDEQKPQEQARGGGLADRENQQGSTCYMSAMLQFYDDGQECDDKTEQDLIFLNDTATQFNLGEYLTEFFQFLATQRNDYLKQCLKGLLREDVRKLQKYIKL